MRTKKFLFATTFAMMAACMMMNTSCTKYVDDAALQPAFREGGLDSLPASSVLHFLVHILGA